MPQQSGSHRICETNQGSLWLTSIALPEVPEAHIIVPSLSCLEEAYQYQWT